MLKVSRSDLIESKQAIASLGNIFMPLGKDYYHLAKKLAKTVRVVNQAIKKANDACQKKSNELIAEFGTMQQDANGKDTQKGIQQTDLVNMDKYTKAMDEFIAELVDVDVILVTEKELQDASASLKVADLVALHWLIAE